MKRFWGKNKKDDPNKKDISNKLMDQLTEEYSTIHQDILTILEHRKKNIDENIIEEFDGDLIIDDMTPNQIILSKMLKICHIKSEVVSDGLQALEKLKTKNYRLIWMDIKMPVLDGIGATKYMKQVFQYTGPIFAVTAYMDRSVDEECFQAGIDYVINKPISLDIVKNVNRMLEDQKIESN